MAIQLTCSCGRRLQVDETFGGKQGQCPACGQVLEIPASAAASPGEGVSFSAPEVPSLSLEPARPVSPPPSLEYTDSPSRGDAGDGLPLYPVQAEVARPPYKLHPPGHIGLVTFLLGSGAGFLLLAVNFYRLGRWAAVWGTLVVALLTLVGLLALTVVTNSILPSIGMSVPLFILLWVAAKGLQGGAYEEHLNKGGEAASGGAAAGIGLLGLGLFVLLGMGGGLLWDLVWQARLGDKLTFGSGEEVYYARGATQAEAAQVGRHLQAVGFFDGRSPKTVLLAREGPRTVVSFVVLKHALSDPQVLQFFRDFGRELSQQDFGGRPVEIRLCDEHLNIQKTLP